MVSFRDIAFHDTQGHSFIIVTLYLWNLTTNFDVTLHEVHPYTDSESWKVSSKLVVRFQRYSVFGAHATSNVYIRLLLKNFCLWVKSNETFHDSRWEYGWTSCQVSSKLVVRFQRYSVTWYRRTFIYYNKDTQYTYIYREVQLFALYTILIHIQRSIAVYIIHNTHTYTEKYSCLHYTQYSYIYREV